MDRVLVTGAAGFLGSHLCAALLAAGHEVFGVDNLLGGDAENVPEGAAFSMDDCCNFHRILNLLVSRAPIDTVYHLAACPHEGLSVFSPATVSLHTYQSTAAVAAAAVQAGVRRIVFTSSMSRYGAGSGRTVFEPFAPFEEWQPTAPVDPYGIAKVAAEQLLLCLGKAHNIEVVIIVPHNIAGPRQRYHDPYRNVVAIMSNLVLQGKQPVIYGDGEQRRCFSHVDDCVAPLVRAGSQAGLDGEVVNVGPDTGDVSVNELARLVAAVAGKPPGWLAPRYFPDRPCEVKVAWPSSDKARRLLGYSPKRTLEETVRSVVEWVRERGPREFLYHLPLEIRSERTPRTWVDRVF